MIRTESLTKYYGNRCAVRNLSVSIDSREIVGFLGLNGAGKTTALRMLAGQLSPSSGRIQIDGQEMTTATAEMRSRIGFLPERPPLYEDMTVRGYLTFAAQLRGYDQARVERRVDEILETTRTRDYAGEMIANLSHGFRQRVGIAQAIVHDPALVILDEPNNGLDPAQIKDMRSLIRELRTRHTVLLSSHMLPEISQTCDRLMVIRDGECVAIGTEAELSDELGSSRKLALDVVGAGATLEQALAALREAKVIGQWTVSQSERTEDAGVHRVELSLLIEHPEDVAKAIVGAGLGLRRLEPRETELEAMFLQLTNARPS